MPSSTSTTTTINTTTLRCLLLFLCALIFFSPATHAWLYPDTFSSLRSALSSSVELDESLDQELLPVPNPLVADQEVVTKKGGEDAANEEEEENVADGNDDVDPANSNSTLYALADESMCPRNREEAVARGRTCLRKCNSDSDCISSRKKCLCDGLCGWSCVRPDLSCDELGEFSNGRKSTPNGNFFNSKVTYECDAGYFMSGVRERVCQGDSSWSGQSPNCKVRPLCGPAPTIPHSKHSLSESTETEFELNTTLTYECFNGYKITGSTEATCQQKNNTTIWIGPSLKCMPISCGDPGDIENGYRESTGHVFTSKVSYFCNEGYILVGRAIRYCQSSGLWSSDMPTCQPVKCDQPEDPKNGRAFYSAYTFGSVVSYQCKSGYRLHGPSNRTCQADRMWSDDTPQCNIIDCGPLAPFPNGYIEADSTTIGSRIRFYCYDNMIFEGAFNSSTCTSAGTWDPWPFPRCNAPCTVPKIANGRVVNYAPLVRLPHRTVINVSCITDYELADTTIPSADGAGGGGSYQHIECANGQWSPQLPRCVPARCKVLPPRPRNGMVMAAKTDHGMRAVFRCRDGYMLEGTNITFCHFGRWNMSVPTCSQIYCPFPGYIEHGKVMLVGHMGMYDYRSYVRRVGNNKQILYECDKGYHIVEGPLGASCIDGHWSPGVMPSCVRFFHPKLSRGNRDLREMKADELTTSDDDAILNPVHHHHHIHHEHTAASAAQRHKRHQLNKIKSSCFSLPEKHFTKVSIFKMGKDNGYIPANGTVSNETYPHGTRVKIKCEEGYSSSNPNRTLIKCAKGRWKPELPDCIPMPCITPTIPNGHFRISSRFHPRKIRPKPSTIFLIPGQSVSHNSTIDLVCSPGYHYPPSATPLLNVTLKCSFGSWDSFASTSTCIPLGCRLPPVPHGGYLNGHEPNQIIEHDVAVKFSCDKGFKRSVEPRGGPDSSDQESSNVKCVLGKLEPELPFCINTSLSVASAGFAAESANNNNNSPRVPPTFCHSPKKIENALHYFGQLFSGGNGGGGSQSAPPHLQPISIAQFDSLESSRATRNSNDSSMLYQYEHGTEIVFRCISYQIPAGMMALPKAYSLTDEGAPEETQLATTNLPPPAQERSTWIIKCDNGNWVGSAFMCEDDLSTTSTAPPESIAMPTKSTPPPLPQPCTFTADDANVLVFNGSDSTQLAGYTNMTFPHDSLILIRCKDIGKYQLTGAKERLCRNGVWSPDEESNRCIGLNQAFDYDVNKPPTIQFRNSNGPIEQTADGKLLVYPGTILHLECLFQRKLGSPSWSWTHPGRAQEYQQQWATEDVINSLAYRLTIFHAKEQDSGVYTCVTPGSHSHSVEVLVKAIHCESLEQSPGLQVSSKITLLGSHVEFSCQPNHDLVGVTSATCLYSGRWSHPIPQCRVTECSSLSSHAHLDSSPSHTSIIPATIQPPLPPNHQIGSTYIFTCPKGFGLMGSHQLHCLETGNWSHPVPYCSEVRCPAPAVPHLGYLEGLVDPQLAPVAYDAGDIVQYTCQSGFMLEGNPISICQENGRWSGPPPRCIAACTYPGVQHGARLLSEVRFFYPLNQTIEFECADGYEMRGNAALKCIESGRWSGSIPECVPESRTDDTRRL